MVVDPLKIQGKAGFVRAFIGLGSNLSDPVSQVKAALRWLGGNQYLKLKQHTDFMETEPWGIGDQPLFVNAVAEIYTGLAPHELLDQLKIGEKELGRKKRTTKWGPREIDLDILLYGDLVLETDHLVIPHAQLTNRSFIVKQLLDLDATLVHPGLGVPLCHFLER
jgi:2-amino-4-hydroxy-6-hydroxymethyldihydropteridine diphosphokinase